MTNPEFRYRASTATRLARGLALSLTLLTAFVVVTFAVAGSADAAYSREYQVATKKVWINGSYWCVTNGPSGPGVGGGSAYGCFETRGDYLQIADSKADGKRVALQWKTGYGRFGLCVNAGGKGLSTEGGFQFPKGHRVCNKDFKEGSWLTFRVGTCNASKVNCSKTANWHGWSDWIKRRNMN